MGDLIKKYCFYIIGCLVLTNGFLLYFTFDKGVAEVKSEPVSLKTEYIEEEEFVYVDIKGEVLNPGVYKINSNLRLIDLVEMANGLTKDADVSLLNLSKKVKDEMSIKIYSKKEVRDAKERLEEAPTIIEVIKEIEKECICPDSNYACDEEAVEEENVAVEEEAVNEEVIEENINELVNINTATKEQLMNLSGIGESKANLIIEYRKTNKFNSIDDIKNVSGIGDSIFEKIKESITV